MEIEVTKKGVLEAGGCEGWNSRKKVMEEGNRGEGDFRV